MNDAPTKNLPRLLLVDDDEAVRETCAALLERDYEVITAQDGAHALRQLDRYTFDALCTDFKMPGMTGVELIAQVGQRPDAPSAVLITAYAEYVRRDRNSPQAPFLLLLKPYTAAQLRETVLRAVEQTRIKRQIADVSRRAVSSG